jgi:hypothetical protein
MRLGHPQRRVLHHVLDRLFVSPKLPVSNTFCKHCVIGKMTQLPFSHSTSCTTFPLEIVHSDVWGPAPVNSINGHRYYVIFVDDFSRFTWFFPLKHKSQVLASFQHFKNTMENSLGTSIKTLRTDCGGEYTNNEFRNFCSNSGIIHQFTCPHTSQQNGVAERKHRHIVDMALTLISQSSLPFSYWSYAFSTAIFLINRLPSLHRGSYSPWETLFAKSPNYSLFKNFGCACFPLLRPYTKHKFNFRSKECVFLGYASNSKGYLCLDPNTSRIYTSRHVTFHESHFPFSHSSSSPHQSSNTSSPSHNWLSSLLFFHPCQTSSVLGPAPHSPRFLSTANPTPSLLGPAPFRIDSLPLNPTHPEPITPQPTSAQPVNLLISPEPNTLPISPHNPAPHLTQPGPLLTPIQPATLNTTQPSSFSSPNILTVSPALANPENPAVSLSTHPMQTRSKSGISKKKSFATSTTIDYLQTEPPTYTIASKFPQWREAMASEFAALQRQHTWQLVPPSSDQNVVGYRWVYKIKRNSDGSVSRYKARLVAKGFHQQAGVDFAETFSPVVKPPTVRIILSLAAQNQWSLRQLDVSNAFLHGLLKETVFMAQPLGFVDSSLPSHVCHLHKSLYGLKQAPRAWFERFTSHLLTLGFKASVADASLFILSHKSITIYLLLYVDDIIITGNNSSAVSNIISQLSAVFELKDLGPLRYFLGLQIDYKKGGFFVHQRKYLTDLLHKFTLTDCKAASTPIATTPLLTSTELLSNPTPYRSLVGALQYATFTRPDITFAVNRVCQFMHKPSPAHLVAAKRILRYLKGTLDRGILFQPGPFALTAFTDADWAGDPCDRRSTSGIIVFLGNNPITWLAKKQHTVSRSSTEAEYRSLANGAAELSWIRQVLCDLGLFLPSAPLIWCDNTSALALASNPVFHGRTKHIEVDYHFIRERVVRGDLKLQFISTEDQLADVFTKALPSPRFHRLCSKLLICSIDHQFEGG